MPRVTSKGQVTIPVAVRFALGIRPGDDVLFAVEDGRGVLRRATGAAGRSRALPVAARAGAHPLERLLTSGDPGYAEELARAAAAGRRVRLPDAVVLELAVHLVDAGCEPALVADTLADVVADRAMRCDRPRALSVALDALRAGESPVAAYALASA
jgi:AbrB family looped-hinge helix DNA binding protein